MPVTYSPLDAAARSSNAYLRKAVACYQVLRKRVEPVIGRAMSVLFRVLPIRIFAHVRERAVRVVPMPYSKPIVVRVDAFRDISRARFPLAEPETVEWIESYCARGDVLYDVGANIGAVSLIAAAHLDGACAVYSFEPAYATYRQLCENITLNHRGDVIHPFMCALSSESGVRTFSYTTTRAGASGHTLTDDTGDPTQYALQQLMFTYTIDDCCRKYHFALPTHIKVDVDGHDFEVLRGAQGVLGAGVTRSILVEQNAQGGDIRRFLEQLGFRMVPTRARDNLLFVRH